MDKATEQFYLESFLKILSPEIPVAIEKIMESPDFIINFGNKRIGVELTEYHSDIKGTDGKPRRAIEENWDLLQQVIMRKVRNSRKLEQTHGLLFFRELRLPPKKLHIKFTDELITLAMEMLHNNISETHPDSNYSLLNKYLRKFIFKQCKCYITWDWNYTGAWIGTSEEQLIEALKSKLTARYSKKNISELWLLIISGHRMSQATEHNLLGDKLKTYKLLDSCLKQSIFKKVYIHQYMFNTIYEWPHWCKISPKSEKVGVKKGT